MHNLTKALITRWNMVVISVYSNIFQSADLKSDEHGWYSMQHECLAENGIKMQSNTFTNGFIKMPPHLWNRLC